MQDSNEFPRSRTHANVELPDDFCEREIPPQCHSLLTLHKILDIIENQRTNPVKCMKSGDSLSELENKMKVEQAQLQHELNQVFDSTSGLFSAAAVSDSENNVRWASRYPSLTDLVNESSVAVREVHCDGFAEYNSGLKFDAETTAKYVNLLNSKSEAIGAGLEYTASALGRDYDGNENPGLVTRIHTRGTVAETLSLKYLGKKKQLQSVFREGLGAEKADR